MAWHSVFTNCLVLDQAGKNGLSLLHCHTFVAMLLMPGGDGLQIGLDSWGEGELTQAESGCKVHYCLLGSRKCCDFAFVTDGLELVDARPVACPGGICQGHMHKLSYIRHQRVGMLGSP